MRKEVAHPTGGAAIPGLQETDVCTAEVFLWLTDDKGLEFVFCCHFHTIFLYSLLDYSPWHSPLPVSTSGLLIAKHSWWRNMVTYVTYCHIWSRESPNQFMITWEPKSIQDTWEPKPIYQNQSNLNIDSSSSGWQVVPHSFQCNVDDNIPKPNCVQIQIVHYSPLLNL